MLGIKPPQQLEPDLNKAAPLLADENDVKNAYRILLGRKPSESDSEKKVGWRLIKLIEHVQNSEEFKALIATDSVQPHLEHMGRGQFRDLKLWMNERFSLEKQNVVLNDIELEDWSALRLILMQNVGKSSCDLEALKALSISKKAKADDASLHVPHAKPFAFEDERQAIALFSAILGRNPSNEQDMQFYLDKGVSGSALHVMKSDEFLDKVARATIAGQSLPHFRLSKGPNEEQINLLQQLHNELSVVPHENIKQGMSWDTFAAELLQPDVINKIDPGNSPQAIVRVSRLNIARESLLKTCAAFIKNVTLLDGENFRVKVRPTSSDDGILSLKYGPIASPEENIHQLDGIKGDGETELIVSVDLSGYSSTEMFRFQLFKGGKALCSPFDLPLGMGSKEISEKLMAIDGKILKDPTKDNVKELESLVRNSPFSKDALIAYAEALGWNGMHSKALDVLEKSPVDFNTTGPLMLRSLVASQNFSKAQTIYGAIENPEIISNALGGFAATQLDDLSSDKSNPLNTFISACLRSDQDLNAGISNIAKGMPRSCKDATLAADIYAALYVPGDKVVQTTKTLDKGANRKVLKLLNAALPASGLAPVYSYMPEVLKETDKSSLALGCASYAKKHLTNKDAYQLAKLALNCSDATKDTRIQAAYLLKNIKLLEARKLASDLFFDVSKADGFGNAKYVEFIGKLENEIIQANPLHPKRRRDHVNKAMRERCMRSMTVNPTSVEQRYIFARQLLTDGKFRSAQNLLEDLHKQDPGSVTILRDLISAGRKTGADKKVVAWSKKLLRQKYVDGVSVDMIRSFRALDRAEDIGKAMAPYKDQANLAVLTELARNHFYCGDFETAYEDVKEVLTINPDNRDALVIAASAAIELKKFDEATLYIDQINDQEINIQTMETQLFKYAIAFGKKQDDKAVEALNEMFSLLGCQNVKLQDGIIKMSYDVLEPTGEKSALPKKFKNIVGPKPVFEGPKVSICMTTYNAEEYVETSVRSLQQQSYKNIEIIISDDCSTDSTPDILKRLAAEDPRIKIILKSTNDGTYVSKNMGILQATGEFIALQDSDDWSHPDRIAKSVAVLLANPEIVGVTTDWFRMHSNGELVIKAGGQISHVCCISFVFRRDVAMNTAGLFDSVRIEADMEYIRRLTLIHGTDAIARLRWPLLIGRAHEESLTANSTYGITRTGFSRPRLSYQKAYFEWHDKIRQGEKSGFMPFPLAERPYSAPKIILPERKKKK